MRDARIKHAIAAQFTQLLIRQRVELLIVDREVFCDHLRLADIVAFVVARLEAGGALREQAELVDFLDELLGTTALAFELAAEIHRIVRELGWRAILEERDLWLVAHHRSVAVDTKNETLLRCIIRKNERIATGESRNVEVRVDITVLHEQVFRFPDAHGADRHLVCTDKDNRVGRCRQAELIHGQRHSMCLAKKREWLFDRLQTETCMLLDIERLRVGIEQHLSAKGIGLGRLRICHGNTPLIDRRGLPDKPDAHNSRAAIARPYSRQPIESGFRRLMRPVLNLARMRPVFALAAVSLAASCGPAVNEDGIARRLVRDINRVMEDTAQAELALSPETATRLGLEEASARASIHDVLDDRSQARFERTRLLRIELLNRLLQTPDIPSESELARHLDVISNHYEALTRLEAYGFGRYALGVARPYAVDQISGAWVDVPDLLVSSQPLRSHEDAEDYLARLAALPDAIADERRRLLSDAKSGVIPPRIVLEELEARLREFASQPVQTHPLIQTFGNVVSGLPAETGRSANTYREAAARTMLDDVIPAYVGFADEVARLQLGAPQDAGMSALEGGEAYYRDLLAFYAMPDVDPEFLHQEAVSAIEAINAEIDAQFEALGLSGGSVGERLAYLAETSGQARPLNAETRPQILGTLRQSVSENTEALPRMVEGAPNESLVVARMPALREATYSGAIYTPATADGTSPGLLLINLGDGEEWPAFTLPTLAAHEGVPGHHTESTLTTQTRNPLLRQMIWDPPFGEGWGTYAEDLADSAGLYADDPLGRLGYLQSILFRAARVVADTGLHSRGWSYQQTVDYLVDTTGLPRSQMEREVLRYLVWPGQAVSYFAGRNRILDMRTRAEAVLGERFDEASFNAVILAGGPRQLELVEADVEAWYQRQLQN